MPSKRKAPEVENQPPQEDVDFAEKVITKRDRLRIRQFQFMPLWDQCAQFCCPQKVAAIRNAIGAIPDASQRPRFNPQVQNSVAMDALNVLSGGLRSWLLPGGAEGWGGQWQSHDPKNVTVNEWLADCTQRSITAMQNGGFFTASHEMFSDLGVFGTGGMMIDDGADKPMFCASVNPANFLFERDNEGEITCVIITYVKPASEIMSMFNLPTDKIPAKVKSDVEKNNGQQEHEIIHEIYKRTDAQMQEKRPEEREGNRYGSRWIHVDDRITMRERGYPEMPFIAPRWLLWSDNAVYGSSPAMAALADMKGLNLFDMLTSAMMEVQVNPRVKVASNQTGAIDLGPGGITQVDGSDIGAVTEWATVSRSDFDGPAFIARKEAQCRRHFHTDLFEAVSPIIRERELTNYVAQALEREAASRITPAMGRVELDFVGPAMLRVFMLLFRAGVFSEPPQEFFQIGDATNKATFIYPRVVMQNRMSAAMNTRKAFAFQNILMRVMPMVKELGQVEVLDNYDFDVMERELSIGDGSPVDWLRDIEEVKQVREDRAAAQQKALAEQTAAAAMAKDPVGVAGLAGLPTAQQQAA